MFACIYIPDFPAAAMVRAEPLLRERAVAVLEGKPPLVRVIALNEKGRLLGMELGMTKLQAAIFAEKAAAADENPRISSGSNISTSPSSSLAVLRQRSLEQETSAHAALLDVAHAFTPRVEDTTSDTLLLDLAGLERLYGAPAAMANQLAARVTAIGIEANIAIAANPDAAMHAARGFDGTTIIPPGSEAQRLGVLPLQVLLDAFEISSQQPASGKSSARVRTNTREQLLDTLERWGVRDFRMLALLPEHALSSRLGEAGVQLRRLARGEGRRTLALCEPPSQLEEAMELESAVETIESLSFVLNRLLEQLCTRLEARALAVQELQLRLQLDCKVADEETTTIQELADSHNVGSKPIFRRNLCLPVSMRDAKVFLKLLQLELAAHPPGAPVTKIWITAQPAPPRLAQRGLFVPLTPDAEKLEITLARISAVVGERRAGIARLLDNHRPESFRLDRFAVAGDDTKHTSTLTTWDGHSNAQPPLAMRLFRPPCPLQVYLMNGCPDILAGEKQGSDREELQGKVVWSAGPWRSSGDWWTENTKEEQSQSAQSVAWDREEWDIALAHKKDGTNGCGAALYRIYRDLATGRWFADAGYD